DRFQEVRRRVMAAHASQLGPGAALALAGELLACHLVARRTPHVLERLAAGVDVAGERCELPAGGNTAQPVQGVHGDAHRAGRGPGDRSALRGFLRALAAGDEEEEGEAEGSEMTHARHLASRAPTCKGHRSKALDMPVSIGQVLARDESVRERVLLYRGPGGHP